MKLEKKKAPQKAFETNAISKAQALEACAIKKCKKIHNILQERGKKMNESLKPLYQKLRETMESTTMSKAQKIKELQKLKDKLAKITVKIDDIDDTESVKYMNCTLSKCLEQNKDVIRLMIEGLDEKANTKEVIKEFKGMVQNSEITATQYFKTYKDMLRLLTKR